MTSGAEESTMPDRDIKEDLLDVLPGLDRQMASVAEAVHRRRPLRELFDIPEEDVVAVLRNAYRLYQHGELEKAETLADGARSLDITKPYPHLLLGLIYREKGRLEESHEYLEDAVDLGDENWKAILFTAEVELDLERYTSARERLRLLTASDGTPENVRNRAKTLLDIVGPQVSADETERGR